jgi:hypothetical protein
MPPFSTLFSFLRFRRRHTLGCRRRFIEQYFHATPLLRSLITPLSAMIDDCRHIILPIAFAIFAIDYFIIFWR